MAKPLNDDELGAILVTCAHARVHGGMAATPRQVERLVAQAREANRLSKAHRSIEDLTPGGSEFVGDPERCARNIREQLDFAVCLKERAMEKAREAQEQARVLAEAVAADDSYFKCPLSAPVEEADALSIKSLNALKVALPIARAILAEKGEGDAAD